MVPPLLQISAGSLVRLFASSKGRSCDPLIAKTVEHAALTAFAFTIGKEDPNRSEPTETQAKAKATGHAIHLAMEASAELEDEEEAVLMSQEAEDEAFLASLWLRFVLCRQKHAINLSFVLYRWKCTINLRCHFSASHLQAY